MIIFGLKAIGMCFAVFTIMLLLYGATVVGMLKALGL